MNPEEAYALEQQGYRVEYIPGGGGTHHATDALLGAVQEISLLRAVVRELVHQSPVTDGRSLTVDDLDLLPPERAAFLRALSHFNGEQDAGGDT